MIDKDGEFYKLGFYLSAALTASLIKFIRSKQKSWTSLFLEVLIGASIAIFLIPMVVEHFGLSLSFGTGLTWFTTIFSKEVLEKVKVKLLNKIDDTTING